MRIRSTLFMFGVCWIVCFTAGSSAASAGAPANGSLEIEDERLAEIVTAQPEVRDAESREGESAAGDAREASRNRLETENRNLRKKVLALKREMSKLSVSLSALRNRYLRLRQAGRFEDAQGEIPFGVGADNARQVVSILDVNREIDLVALGAGTGEGLRPGLIYRVIRDGKLLATVRVEVVRRNIAGAEVLEYEERYPAPGDRVVLGRPSKGSD